MESVRWGGAVADQPGLLEPGQGQVKKPVRPPVHQQPVAEIAQHAVVKARIVKVEAERVLEVDPASHRLGGVTVREIEQELQHAHRCQLARRDSGPPVPGIPAGEVLVRPQAVEPVPHPHRCRPGRVASPRHPRGQLRDSTPRRGRIDITHSSGISWDSYPRKTGPGRHCSQPNTKIPDRVKLMACAVMAFDRRINHPYRLSRNPCHRFRDPGPPNAQPTLSLPRPGALI